MSQNIICSTVGESGGHFGTRSTSRCHCFTLRPLWSKPAKLCFPLNEWTSRATSPRLLGGPHGQNDRQARTWAASSCASAAVPGTSFKSYPDLSSSDSWASNRKGNCLCRLTKQLWIPSASKVSLVTPISLCQSTQHLIWYPKRRNWMI